VPPRRKREGAAPGKTGLLDRTKPDNGPADKTWEQLKAELVADLAGPQERAPDDVGAHWLDLPEDKGGAAETRPARPGARKPKTGSRSRGDAKPKAAARRRSKRTTRRNGRRDLNGATFDELRSLGLSVTQSKRLIAYRDARGGYASLDELDEVPGLSKATRAELRSRLKLGS
jgi:hypothetical protein